MNSPTRHSRPQRQDILAHYAAEVGRNIEALVAMLASTKDYGALMLRRAECIKALQRIKDLAMIHGYECVEAVAEKMENSLRHFAEASRETTSQFIDRLQRALAVLRQLMAMADDREAQRLLREAEYVMDFAIDNLEINVRANQNNNGAILSSITENDVTLKNANPSEMIDTTSQKQPDTPEEDLEFFDIREPDFRLFDEIDHRAYPPEQNDEGAVSIISIDKDATIAIQDVFDEILTTKLVRELDRLAAAIERVYISRDGIHGIQEIRDICASLKNASEQLGESIFNEIIFPLEKVARKCLQDEDDSALVLQTIARAEESLRIYLTTPVKNRQDLEAMKAELETMLFLYDGQNDAFVPRETMNSLFHDEYETLDDQYALPAKQPVFSRLRRLFGMA